MSINVIIKRVGCLPVTVTMPNMAKRAREIVGGNIDVEEIGSGIVIVKSESAVMDGSKKNCEVCGEMIFGDFFVCGFDGKRFRDCPLGVREFRERYGILR